MLEFETSADIAVPKTLIDQVIGQEQAAAVVRLAALQRRFLLIIGAPGTGKSLLGRAVAELMAPLAAQSIVAMPNPAAPYRPTVKVMPTPQAEAQLASYEIYRRRFSAGYRHLIHLGMVAAVMIGAYFSLQNNSGTPLIAGLLAAALLWHYRKRTADAGAGPKILVRGDGSVPFIDATGCRDGALFGDVRHDPYQSGGVETPVVQLVEAGMVHRAHGGVLFIDEVATLALESQQLLLTAVQEKALTITGRSAGSSGTMIATDPVPCDFVLVLAGNTADLEGLHPALRSRVQGYGYEVCTFNDMPDAPAQHEQLARFVAQEVMRDGRIPHATRAAIEALIEIARERCTRPLHLTTRFRELGGLLRIAGDLAVRSASPLIEARHIKQAKFYARPAEEQALNSAPPPVAQP